MSEIHGLGPGQPIRPLNPGGVAPSRPASEAESAPGFGTDAVSVGSAPQEALPPKHFTVVFSGHGDELFMQDFEAVVDPQALRDACQVQVEVEALDIDGFFVAGTGPAEAGLTRGAGVGAANPTGPIAVLDEPPAEVTSFPDLDLNGPGSAHLGIWSMGGSRIA